MVHSPLFTQTQVVIMVSMNRPRWSTFALLVAACAVTLATSQSNESSGESIYPWGWVGDSQRFEVVIAPQGNILATFPAQGELFLGLKVYRIAQEDMDLVRWSASIEMPGEDVFVVSGGLEIDEELSLEEDGKMYAAVGGLIGRFCEAGETADDGCLPCQLEAGCSLTIDIDRCHPHPEPGGETRAELVIVRKGGEPFLLDCFPEDDPAPCDALDEWVTATPSPVETGLCTN